MSYALEVVRTNLNESRVETIADPADVQLGSGEAIIAVNQFALTANNITYGVAGDMIGYWQFFPAEGDWGRIPVWGIGTVLNPGDTGLQEGAQYYGYFPMASYLVVKPENVSERGFVDGAAHRAPLPPTYNQYSLMTAENGFDRNYDAHRMTYFPLFATGFILDDYLFDNDFFGADQIVLSSASSKTSFSLAQLLHKRGTKTVVGLTSPGNVDFVKGMGIYDDVITYDSVTSMDSAKKTAFVDMAGNRTVLEALHNHFTDNMVCSCGVGITHWESRDGQPPAELPGAKPEMFFAPTQMQKRNQDWGPEKFQQNMNDAWTGFLADVDNWVTINQREGADAIKDTYHEVLNGAKPDQAFLLNL